VARHEEARTDLNDEHHHARVDGVDGGSCLLAETLTELTEQIALALSCSECCIYEYLAERRALRAQAIWSEALSDRDRAWVGRMNDLQTIPDFARVVSRRELIVSYAADETIDGVPGPETMTYWGELAAVCAPMVQGDEVLGILELTEKRRERRFSEAELRLVRQMADLAALALRSARDSRATEARNRQLTALIDSSKAMTSTLDIDEVLDVVCRQAARALDSQSSYIYEFDTSSFTLVWLAQYQRDPSHGFEEPLGTVYPLEDMPQDRAVVETRRPVQVSLDDPDIDPVVRAQLLDWEELSSLMVPLVVGQDLVGLLEVSESERLRRYTDDEIELCTALGEQAAVAIRNAQMFRQLQDQKQIIERQAITDGLTGLSNHRHFFERLRAEAARAQRYGFALSVVMLDLDDFKSINDRFGHPAGDRVLRTVGETLRDQLRGELDVPARYGGEEFAVILPHTGPLTLGIEETTDGARAAAERLRVAIAEAGLPLPVPVDGLPAHITASVGVATLPAQAVDADDLVSKADTALYKAKQLGKDRVEVYVRG
jgi:diguanylate cyclase (GGDEF)-like protein